MKESLKKGEKEHKEKTIQLIRNEKNNNLPSNSVVFKGHVKFS